MLIYLRIVLLLPILGLMIGCGALQVGYSPLNGDSSYAVESPQVEEDSCITGTLHFDTVSSDFALLDTVDIDCEIGRGRILDYLDIEEPEGEYSGNLLSEFHPQVESVLQDQDAESIHSLQQAFANRVMREGRRFHDPVELTWKATLSLLDWRPEDALYDARMAFGLTLTRKLPDGVMEPLPEFDWPVGKFPPTGATPEHDKRIFSAYKQYLLSRSTDSIRRLDLRMSMRPLPMSARIGKRGNVVLTIFEEDLSIRPAFPLVVDYSMGLIELQGRIAYLILLSGILSDDIDAIKLGANSLKDAIDPVWVRDEY